MRFLAGKRAGKQLRWPASARNGLIMLQTHRSHHVHRVGRGWGLSKTRTLPLTAGCGFSTPRCGHAWRRCGHAQGRPAAENHEKVTQKKISSDSAPDRFGARYECPPQVPRSKSTMRSTHWPRDLAIGWSDSRFPQLYEFSQSLIRFFPCGNPTRRVP